MAMNSRTQFLEKLFPRSKKYDSEWILSNSLGENVLFNMESLAKVLRLKPEMKVLDLGCGKAISSIFLAKEFGCKVWAVDNTVSVEENTKRVRRARCEGKVIPVQSDARKLPFEKEFFDVIVAVDSYMYYGTRKSYLPYLMKFLKPGGYVGVVDACFTQEIEREGQHGKKKNSIERALRTMFRKLHTPAWWRELWRKSGLVEVLRAELIPGSKVILKQFAEDFKNDESEGEVARLIAQDRDSLVGLFRLVARKPKLA